jgi:hypothetical protein
MIVALVELVLISVVIDVRITVGILVPFRFEVWPPMFQAVL